MPRFLGDMRGHAGLPEVSDEVGAVISLVSSERQPPGRSGGMAMNHFQGSLPLGMVWLFRAISLGQVALDDQPAPVFHQGVPHEAQHCASARLRQCQEISGRAAPEDRWWKHGWRWNASRP